jgi:hypothetical protein
VKTKLGRIAWIVTIAVMTIATAHRAQAQERTGLSVAVLSFGNSSGYGGSALGLRASSAIENALLESGRFDVAKRDQVTKTMSDLGLSYPLGRTGLLKLAETLEVEAIVTGDVTSVLRNPKTGQVSVGLRVEMTDKSSGELINGASVKGESGIRPDFSGSEDILLDEAMSKVAFAAVRSMNDRILPQGTVFTSSTSQGRTEVLLNIGSNSGVRDGMEMIVLRNGEQVGRLRVTSVTPTDSLASVISTTRGVQPEDKVRAVFRMDHISSDQGGTGRSESVISRPKTNVQNVLLGAAALFGLYRLTQGKTGSGSAGATDGQAVSTGPNNGAPGSDSVPFTPSIHIKWRKPYGIKDQDILGYFVYRADVEGTAVPVRFGERGETDVYDNGMAYSNSFETDPTSDLDVDDENIDGLVPGVSTRYAIKTVWVKYTTGTDGTVDDGEATIAQTLYTNAATALLTPPAVTADITNLQAAEFTFQQVPGGDRYVIQVSDNPSFSRADTYPKDADGFGLPAPPSPPLPVGYFGELDDATGLCTRDIGSEDICYSDPRDNPIYSPQATVTVNLQTGNIDPTTPGQTLYWRVGVRASRDSRKPENGGYVWGPFRLLNATTSLTATTPAVPPAEDEITTEPGTSRGSRGRTTGSPIIPRLPRR